MFKGILSGSVNYYNRKQQDLLGDYNVPVPPYLFSTTFVNVGTMRNTGIEVDLNIQAVKMKDFSYTVNLVGATNENKSSNSPTTSSPDRTITIWRIWKVRINRASCNA